MKKLLMTMICMGIIVAFTAVAVVAPQTAQANIVNTIDTKGSVSTVGQVAALEICAKAGISAGLANASVIGDIRHFKRVAISVETIALNNVENIGFTNDTLIDECGYDVAYSKLATTAGAPGYRIHRPQHRR